MLRNMKNRILQASGCKKTEVKEVEEIMIDYFNGEYTCTNDERFKEGAIEAYNMYKFIHSQLPNAQFAKSFELNFAS